MKNILYKNDVDRKSKVRNLLHFLAGLILLSLIAACEPGDDPQNEPETKTNPPEEQPGGGIDGKIGEWGEGDEGETTAKPMS